MNPTTPPPSGTQTITIPSSGTIQELIYAIFAGCTETQQHEIAQTLCEQIASCHRPPPPPCDVPPPPLSFHTTREVMQLLHVSRATLFRLIARGILKPIPLDTRANYFSAKAVKDLLPRYRPEDSL